MKTVYEFTKTKMNKAVCGENVGTIVNGED